MSSFPVATIYRNLQTLNAYLRKCKIHSPNNQTLNAYVRKCQIQLPIIRYPF